MRQLLRILKIRPDERPHVLALLAVLVALQACGIGCFWDSFSTGSLESGDVFFRDFHVSGFDPITYFVTTYWRLSTYQVYRHPLLAFFVLPFFLLNKLLILLFGINMVQVVLALPLLFAGVYSFVFLYRILREQVGLARLDALLSDWLFMGFAYVMVSLTVADHFAVSMLLLIAALYVSGLYMQRRQTIGVLPAALMFLLTAGVTLSNGLKIFIDQLFVNGRRFFRPRFLLLAVVMPVVLVFGFAKWEDYTYVRPKERHNRSVRQQAEYNRKLLAHAAFMDTTVIADSAARETAFKKEYRRLLVREAIERSKKLKKGKPISTESEFARWTDIGTERWPSLVENFFGESLQLHPDYLLDDLLRERPVIVEYRSWLNYAVELLLVVLFVAGIWCGRQSRFLWMALAGFAIDLLIHLGLGFGLNEVYIMSPHWLFVMPIATAFFLHRLQGRPLLLARAVLFLTTLFLWGHNASLLISFYCSIAL
ncbi:MAG: GtrA family protein [Prevotella sp.]|nr:GtrA family protein [Prevotella sp.]